MSIINVISLNNSLFYFMNDKKYILHTEKEFCCKNKIVLKYIYKSNTTFSHNQVIYYYTKTCYVNKIEKFY